MRPYAEVSRLASSASFYSAVCHPLRLQYLRADAHSVVYGAGDLAKAASADPVFEVRAVDGDEDRPLTRARLVLSAHSPSAVSDFHAAGLRANPDLAKIGGESHFLRHPAASAKGGGESRARVSDLDGNIMEVVYLPPSHYPPDHPGSTVRRTQSSSAEASRILDWNLDVATCAAPPTARPPHHRAASASASASARRPARPAADDAAPYMTLRRSVTTSTVETAAAPPARPREQDDEEKSSGGFGLVGAVLGAVAAGAAIGGAMTYMNMRGSSAADEREKALQPQRRPAYPDPYPAQGQGQPQRYVEVERTVEKIRYPEDYPPVRGSRHYPPPSYVARYSQAAPTARPYEVEELDDRASRHTARPGTAGRPRTRSEAAGSARKPLMIADAEHRSNAGGSRYTTAPPPAPKMLLPAESRAPTARHVRPDADVFSRAASKASVPRAASRHHADADTYVSKRTSGSRRPPADDRDRERGAARPSPLARADTMPPPPPQHQPPLMRSRSSRLPAMPVPTGGRRLPPGAKATMYADAGMVPLPPSEVGSTWDDDNDSVAPSDSISCIGSRRSDRSRR